MKKLLTALMVGLLALPVMADIPDSKVKEFIIKDNDITKCYFPEIWKNPDDMHDILNKWAESEKDKGRFSLFTRIYYRLPYAILGDYIDDVFINDNTYDHNFETQRSRLTAKYGRTTTVKSKKDCKKIGEFIYEDLLKNY
ncbi:hypothetical protein A1D22_05685 [Pasteurellaceae bacterium LFhippo2]|nr:hypothetical protein [Pasteurellaceae bacterium LFhippo2]